MACYFVYLYMAARTFLVIALLICSCPFGAKAQLTVFDSLSAELKKHTLEDSLHVNILNRLAFDSYFRHPEGALRFAYKALIISEKILYTNGTAEAYRQIGLVLWSQANYANALEILFKGLKLIEGNSKALQNEADLLGNIGLVYNSMADYGQAQEFLNRSIELQRVLKNATREAAMLNNIGDSYRFQNEYTKALEAYQQALKLRIKSGDLITQGTNLRNIGNVYEAMGEFDNAFKYYFKSLKISESKNDRRGMCLTKQSLASIYFKLKQYALARQFAFESLKESKEDNQKAILRDNYKLLWQLAEEENKSFEALKYYKLYTTYKDSVENVSVSSRISTVRLNYEMQKKQSEIDFLKKEDEVQAIRNSRNSNMLVFAAIIVLLFTVLYFRQKSISTILSRKNLEIKQQQIEITLQNDELIALNEEIRSQQDEVIAQHDILFEKNEEIQTMNTNVIQINENLEKLVAARTSVLQEQNQTLSDYAFHNAHNLRAPLASILGLINLLYKNPSSDDFAILLEYLKNSSEQLDQVVRSINKSLEKGMDAFPETETHKALTSKIV